MVSTLTTKSSLHSLKWKKNIYTHEDVGSVVGEMRGYDWGWEVLVTGAMSLCVEMRSVSQLEEG